MRIKLFAALLMGFIGVSIPEYLAISCPVLNPVVGLVFPVSLIFVMAALSLAQMDGADMKDKQ